MLDAETKTLLEGYKLNTLLNKKNLGAFHFVGYTLINPSINDLLLKVGINNLEIEEETTNALKYNRRLFNSISGDAQVDYERRVNKKKTVYTLKVFIERGEDGRHFKLKVSKLVARYLIERGALFEKINTYT